MKILVIKSLIIILFVKIPFAQDVFINEEFKPLYEDINISEDKLNKFYLSTHEKLKSEDKIENMLLNYSFILLQKEKQKEYSFDITSSFGSNIKFGGFWNQYAIINFTPQMYIQPFNFINIYANHNISCFVPISEVKRHFKSFAFQGLAVLAIENSIKYLFNSNHWMLDVISFAVKNLVINYFLNSSLKDNNESTVPMLENKNYYYAISIRF